MSHPFRAVNPKATFMMAQTAFAHMWAVRRLLIGSSAHLVHEDSRTARIGSLIRNRSSTFLLIRRNLPG
ncbi:hypothetical protein IE4872_PC00133 (plasmid) [Rhizobium gallicum]|uniref:Uncharacterized protein n=1 Tax=Rhizobium gallicum TaxID=56730 RepID=A0A1L5NQK9_9HYPH|nr:hypothetical protein IE4872_PC00133 [Rhizobium gallicum]